MRLQTVANAHSYGTETTFSFRFNEMKMIFIFVMEFRFYISFPHSFHIQFKRIEMNKTVWFHALTSSLAGPLCNPSRTFEYFFMNTRHTTYAMILLSFLSASVCVFISCYSLVSGHTPLCGIIE